MPDLSAPKCCIQYSYSYFLLLKRNCSYTMYTNIPSTTDFLKSVILYNCFQSNQIQYLKSADSLQRNMIHEKVLRTEAFSEGTDADTLNV